MLLADSQSISVDIAVGWSNDSEKYGSVRTGPDVSDAWRNEVAAVAFPLRQNNAQVVQEEVQQLLSPVGSAKILSSSNRLVVIDTGAYLRRMRDLLGGYGLAAGDQETIVIHLNAMKAEFASGNTQPAFWCLRRSSNGIDSYFGDERSLDSDR